MSKPLFRIREKFDTKTEAKHYADRIRQGGKNARVRKSGKKWAVLQGY